MMTKKEILKMLKSLTEKELEEIGLVRIKKVRPPKVKPPKKVPEKIIPEEVRYITYKRRYTKWIYHRTGPKAGQKWYKKRVWKKVKRKVPFIPKWITTKKYIDKIKNEIIKDKQYTLGEVEYPPKRYINKKDLVCSNRKAYPKGKYFACSFCCVLIYDGTQKRIRNFSVAYKPRTPFKVIKEWALTSGYDIMDQKTEHSAYQFDEIIAYSFTREKEHQEHILKYITPNEYLDVG